VRIDPNLGISEQQPTDRVGGASSASRPAPSAASGSGSDEATLSPDALRLSELSSTLASVPEIRQDRVAPLRQAISNGTYAPTNDQIAQAMMNDFQSGRTAAP